jgi:hypothetical protein
MPNVIMQNVMLSVLLFGRGPSALYFYKIGILYMFYHIITNQ